MVKAPTREARPQRAVLVRERQEVQALPRRGLRPSGAGDQRDLEAELAALRSASTRPRATWASTTSASRLAELEKEVSRPDLWDDPDDGPAGDARSTARVSDDIDLLEDLERRAVRRRGRSTS